MQRHIPISSLPVELSVDDAVAAACATDLAFIEERLRLGQSVLVECDKELTLHLLLAVRARFRRQKAAGDTSAPVMSIVDGRGVYCLNVGGVQIDETVVNAFLSAVAPAGLAASMRAAQLLQADHDGALAKFTSLLQHKPRLCSSQCRRNSLRTRNS